MNKIKRAPFIAEIELEKRIIEMTGNFFFFYEFIILYFIYKIFVL